MGHERFLDRYKDRANADCEQRCRFARNRHPIAQSQPDGKHVRPADRRAARDGARRLSLSRARRPDRDSQRAAGVAASRGRISGLSSLVTLGAARLVRHSVYTYRDGRSAMGARHANCSRARAPQHGGTLGAPMAMRCWSMGRRAAAP